MKYIVDTNVVLGTPDIINEFDVVIPKVVLREIENLELKKSDRELQMEIRHEKRILFSKVNSDETSIFDTDSEDRSLEGYAIDYADNVIVQKAKENNYGIITNDVLMILKARSLGIECISPMFNTQDTNAYEGVTNVMINSRTAELYQYEQELLSDIEEKIGNPNSKVNFKEKYDWLKENQYLIFWDKAKPTIQNKDGKERITGYQEIGVFKFDGNNITRVNNKNCHIRSTYENVSPRNVRQRCAIDMLKDDKIKIKALFGTFGAGKDYLMLSQALSVINDPQNEIDKIVWVRNNIEVKDSNPIGFLPNDLEDKLKPFLMPLVDHLGGEEAELDKLIFEKKVEVQHLGFIRGRDIKNSIIYVTEVQSNTLEHIQLLIGRVGEGSQIWFNGDDRQTDGAKFERNNGVKALKKLAGQPLYGQVTLDKTERSEVARMSALLDE